MWLLDNSEFDQKLAEEYYGFIYEITNLQTGQKYIGRKYFTKAKQRQVKGKKKKTRVSSDWESYYGSNKRLKEDVERLGPENFRREIIHLCKTRGETNFWEAKTLFERDVLRATSPDGVPLYYNDWISCKIHSSHVKPKAG